MVSADHLTYRALRPSVLACSQQFASLAALLPIGFRPSLPCLLPGGFEFRRYAVSSLEIHLIRRLPAKCRVWQS